MKHTPGPWRITGTATRYVEARLDGGWVQEIAAVGPTVADGGYGEQQEANARLIAAAPELLEALQKLLSEADEGWPSPDARASAAAAISKATGEQV